jgi:hypothetical protein
LLFDCRLECRQGSVPEPVEVLAQCRDAFGVELIDPAVADLSVNDQSRLLEHLEVLRDGGSAHWQLARQIHDGTGPIGEAFEDRAPRRIAKGSYPIGSVS